MSQSFISLASRDWIIPKSNLESTTEGAEQRILSHFTKGPLFNSENEYVNIELQHTHFTAATQIFNPSARLFFSSLIKDFLQIIGTQTPKIHHLIHMHACNRDMRSISKVPEQKSIGQWKEEVRWQGGEDRRSISNPCLFLLSSSSSPSPGYWNLYANPKREQKRGEAKLAEMKRQGFFGIDKGKSGSIQTLPIHCSERKERGGIVLRREEDERNSGLAFRLPASKISSVTICHIF